MENFKFNSNDITLEKGADKNAFCKVWPNVKQGLELLRSIIKNPIAKAAVSIVIAAGDAIC